MSKRFLAPFVSASASLPRTPPRFTDGRDGRCPSWPLEVPGPSTIPRLYSLLSKSSQMGPLSPSNSCDHRDVQAESYAAGPPVSAAVTEVATSPQNWRLRRVRPTVTEGGIRMIGHWLGNTTRYDCNTDSSHTPDCILHASRPTCGEIRPVNHETDRTLVERVTGSVCVKKEENPTVKPQDADGLALPASPATSAIWKGTRRF